MRGIGGAMAVAVAALLVCCSADSHQDQEANGGEQNSADRYDAAGHKTRNLDSIGGAHLIRGVRETRPMSGFMTYLMSRPYNSYGGKHERWPAGSELAKFYNTHKRNFDEIDRSDLNPFIGKRNFDEIDLSDLNPFMGKRNFDEIDHSSLPFSYATKRYYHTYGNNYLDTPIEAWKSGSDKKRLRPDYPMDEIDLSYFPIGSKRSPGNSIQDVERYYSSGVDKKRHGAQFQMDEIDLSHFPIGSRRSLPLR